VLPNPFGESLPGTDFYLGHVFASRQHALASTAGCGRGLSYLNLIIFTLANSADLQQN